MFVGRESELAALTAAYAAPPAVMMVEGEPGIGKSRLVAEFTARLADETRVLRGDCLEGLPFAPFVTVLRQLARDFGVRGGSLARLLPELGEPLAEPDPELGRARLLEEMLLLIERAAQDQPVVLVIEDLHLADGSTLEALSFLAANLNHAQVLIVGTHRPVKLPLPPTIQRLRLPPLTRPQIATLLTHLQGREVTPSVVRELADRSQGNPLFVEALAEAGTATSLHDLLLTGFERLTAEHRQVVRTAAVAGTWVSHRLLVAVTRLEEQVLEEALHAIIAEKVMEVSGEGYGFRHALIREAVYAGLLPGERLRLHARYAEESDNSPAYLMQLAHHWYAAGRPEPAFEMAWQAARQAFTYVDQLIMLERVLDLWHQVSDPGARLRRAAAEAPSTTANTFLSCRVRQSGDRAFVLCLAAQAALQCGENERGMELVTVALKEIDHDREPERASWLIGTRAQLQGRLGRHPVADFQEAVRLAPPGRIRGALLAQLAFTHYQAEQRKQARARATEALESCDGREKPLALLTLAALDADHGLFDEAAALAEQAGAHDTLLLIAVNQSRALEAQGESVRAEAAARAGIDAAGRFGLARTRGTLLAANLAQPLLSQGRWSEAAKVIEEALLLDPPPIFRADLLVQQGTLAVATGDLDAATAAAATVRELMSSRSSGQESCLEPSLLECRIPPWQTQVRHEEEVSF